MLVVVLYCLLSLKIDSLSDPVLAKEALQSKSRIEQTYAVLQRLILACSTSTSESHSEPLLFAKEGAFTLSLWYWAWLSVQVGGVFSAALV